MKGKNSHVFLLKKVGGALIRVGALNRDYTVNILRTVNFKSGNWGQNLHFQKHQIDYL